MKVDPGVAPARLGATLLLLCGTVVAGDAEAVLRAIAEGKLPIYELRDLQADDATTREVCEAALTARLDDPRYRVADSMAGNHMRSKDKFERFSRHLTELAERSDAETADGTQARLNARFVALRVGRKRGKPAPASAWLEVAAGYVRLHEQRPDAGRPLAHAVELLRLGRTTHGVEATELTKKEKEIDALAQPLYAKEPRFRLLEFEGRRSSKKELQELLTELEPLLGEEDTLLRFYNETVALALGAKVKASFRTVKRTIAGGLVVEVPAGRDWVWSDIGKSTVLAQFEVDGPLRRLFEFASLAGTSKETANAAARQLVALARAESPDSWREPKLRKKKLNRAFGKASWFEIKGTSKEGEPFNTEAWVFRGKSRTYVLMTLTMGRRKRSDPVLRAILDGLHE